MKNAKIIAILLLAVFVALFVLRSCSGNGNKVDKNHTTTQQQQVIEPPAFNSDSAMAYIQTQVNFGPRVPNTDAHKKCGDWIASELKRHGASVMEQKSTAETWDKKNIEVRNIVGAFNPEAKKRIVLAAHWDTRAYGDKDSLEVNKKKPIDGANDGASGVGVLLELARLMAIQKPTLGIDLIFFDAEDNGAPEWAPEEEQGNPYNWCLGSQYWSKNFHKPNYNARFGILLDMVGAKNARFNKEGFSVEAAPDLVDRVWKTASNLGYGEYFPNEVTGEIVDDHVFMNQSGIRSIDIVDMRPATKTMGFNGYEFGSFHHTHKDNMSIISKETLKAVGHTVSYVMYN
ncbi:MAG: M28 family peptidase [Flavobacteriales bacterium]|jgi:hypothetical protein